MDQQETGELGLMKPETDALRSAHDLRQLCQGHLGRPAQAARHHQSRGERPGAVGID